MRRLFYLFLSMFMSLVIYCQENKQGQLAYHHYKNGNFEEAIKIYNDLNRKSISANYYTPHLNCLINIEAYKKAERLSYRMTKKYPHNLNYLVDLGFLQKKNGNSQKAKNNFSKAIKKITKNTGQTVGLGNMFLLRKEFDWGLKMYEKAQELNPNYPYNFQIANIYRNMGRSEKMIESYLLLIKKHPKQKQNVKNNLQSFLNNDGITARKNYEIVKNQLIKYVQNERENIDFSDMLIWLYMQNHEFHLAYNQAKAIDKRLKENGERIINLADIFFDNSYYNLAIQAYKYVIYKGSENIFYIEAHMKKLYVYHKMIENGNKNINLGEVQKEYQHIVQELGENKQTILLLSNYAHFMAFYQHNLEIAANILEKAMLIPNLDPRDLAKCKLEYADIMLLSNKIWSAVLYYSQVEKNFKENPLGHEAKFRKAKVSYYQGDFQWAQAQLDILKASTSKLIANDAMKLSLIITDNLGLDTSEIPMQIYSKADLLFFQNKYTEAISSLNTILEKYNGHSLTDEVLFMQYKIYIKRKEIAKAIKVLERIQEEFYYDILADDAIFNLAKIYQNKLKNQEKAKELYEVIIVKYKGSIYTAEARKQFRGLRGDFKNAKS